MSLVCREKLSEITSRELFTIKPGNKSKLNNPKRRRKSLRLISEPTYPKTNERKFTQLMKSRICRLDIWSIYDGLIIGLKRAWVSKEAELPKRLLGQWKPLRN